MNDVPRERHPLALQVSFRMLMSIMPLSEPLCFRASAILMRRTTSPATADSLNLLWLASWQILLGHTNGLRMSPTTIASQTIGNLTYSRAAIQMSPVCEAFHGCLQVPHIGARNVIFRLLNLKLQRSRSSSLQIRWASHHYWWCALTYVTYEAV